MRIPWLTNTLKKCPAISQNLLHCLPREETQKGKIRLDHPSANLEDRQEAELWARSLEAIEFGEMPSDKADKFPTKAKRLVQDWIAQSLDRAGRKVEDKAGKEGYGNLIPHDLLFSPAESKRVVNAAARLWRISPKALADIVRGARMVSNPFVLDKPHGNFRDFKGKYAFNSLMAEQVTELALAHSEKEAKNARKAIVMMKEKGSTIDEANREATAPLSQRSQADSDRGGDGSDDDLLKKVDRNLAFPLVCRPFTHPSS